MGYRLLAGAVCSSEEDLEMFGAFDCGLLARRAGLWKACAVLSGRASHLAGLCAASAERAFE